MKIFLNLFLISILTFLQISFFSIFSYPIYNLNIVLIVILFITIILNYRLGLYLGVLAGVIIDFYSVSGFGLVTIAFLTMILSINTLFNNFFTNRSFYSLLILSFIGIVIYNITLIIFKFIFYFLKINEIKPNLDYFLIYNFFWQIVLNLILVSLMFLIFNTLSKRLKSVFLVK